MCGEDLPPFWTKIEPRRQAEPEVLVDDLDRTANLPNLTQNLDWRHIWISSQPRRNRPFQDRCLRNLNISQVWRGFGYVDTVQSRNSLAGLPPVSPCRTSCQVPRPAWTRPSRAFSASSVVSNDRLRRRRSLAVIFPPRRRTSSTRCRCFRWSSVSCKTR